MTIHLGDREAVGACGATGTVTYTRHVGCSACAALISEGEHAPVVHLSAAASGVACEWSFHRTGRVGLCTDDYGAVTCPECVDAVERGRCLARRSTLHLRALDTRSNVCGAPSGGALRTNCYADVTCAECVAEVERARQWARKVPPDAFHLPLPNGANLCDGATKGLITFRLESACSACVKAVEQEREVRDAMSQAETSREQRVVDAVLAGVERLLDGAGPAGVEVTVHGCHDCPFWRPVSSSPMGGERCAWREQDRRGHPQAGVAVPDDCPLWQGSARVVLRPSAR